MDIPCWPLAPARPHLPTLSRSWDSASEFRRHGQAGMAISTALFQLPVPCPRSP